MGLTFFIAKSKDMATARHLITTKDVYADISEELQEYIYRNRSILDSDIQCLIDIDPYDDTVLECERIVQIKKACRILIESNFLQGYKDLVDATNMLIQLEIMCEKAVIENKYLLALGD